MDGVAPDGATHEVAASRLWAPAVHGRHSTRVHMRIRETKPIGCFLHRDRRAAFSTLRAKHCRGGRRLCIHLLKHTLVNLNGCGCAAMAHWAVGRGAALGKTSLAGELQARHRAPNRQTGIPDSAGTGGQATVCRRPCRTHLWDGTAGPWLGMYFTLLSLTCAGRHRRARGLELARLGAALLYLGAAHVAGEALTTVQAARSMGKQVHTDHRTGQEQSMTGQGTDTLLTEHRKPQKAVL